MRDLPLELILKVLFLVPDGNGPFERGLNTKTLRHARLVSRAWSKFLLPVLFRDVLVALYPQSKAENNGESHTLEKLCSFFASNPHICAVIQTLKIDDDLSKQKSDSEDEDKDEDDDDEEAEGSTLQKYRCSTNPSLLRRTISYLPSLQNLYLHYMLIAKPLVASEGTPQSEPDSSLKPLRLKKLRISLPGWDDPDDHSPLTAQLVCNTLTVFDAVDTVRVNMGYEDLKYVGIIRRDLDEAYKATQYKVRSLEAPRTTPDFIRMLAANLAFSELSSISITGYPAAVNVLVDRMAGTLERLDFNVQQPSAHVPAFNTIIDLSACHALTDLTLNCAFHPGEARERELAEQIGKILATLLQRPPSTPALAHFTIRLHAQTASMLRDGTWPLQLGAMRALEDALLRYVDAKIVDTVHFQLDLTKWYYSKGLRVRLRLQPKGELDAQYDMQVQKCFTALKEVFARLDQRGAVQLSLYPMDLFNMHGDPDYDC